jgi:hypothetical protein
MPVAERGPGRQPGDQPGNAKDGRATRWPPTEGWKPSGAPDPSRQPQRRTALLHDIVPIIFVHRHAITVAPLPETEFRDCARHRGRVV